MRNMWKIARCGLVALALATGCVSSTTAPERSARQTTPGTGARFSGYMVVSGRHAGPGAAGNAGGNGRSDDGNALQGER